MLKKLVNEAFFTLRITATGPILVKSGHATVRGPDMTPVLTFRNGQQEVFLPGSSLKGVFRSHSEKVICSLKQLVVCYPFSSGEDKEGNNDQEGNNKEVNLELRRKDYRDSCGAVFNQLARDEQVRKKLEDETHYVYANSCPTCRLFGSTSFIGRISINDAYLSSRGATELSNGITEQRDGVGIDRLTGGASSGAKFELEVVSAGAVFETDIHLRNFEVWQLGMLFVVLQDLADELIRIGSGRSRGLGKVTAQISDEGRNGRPGGFVTSSMRGINQPENELWGLGRWLNDGSYGTQQSDLLKDIAPSERSQRGIRSQRIFSGEALAALQEAAIADFIERMQGWQQPDIPKYLPDVPEYLQHNGYARR
jgi:CRISPR-associated RAMP protein (TIGR02581 family)